jgi:hypothetical protein
MPFELGLLSLRRDQFPNSVATARELADVWASDLDRWRRAAPSNTW